jgi:dGTPase
VNHDIDDGLRAELFSVADLETAPFVGAHVLAIGERYGHLEFGRLSGEIVRRLMSAMIGDMVEETGQRLQSAKPASAADVRGRDGALVAFSPAMAGEIGALKAFLFARMYRHPRVMASMQKAQIVVADLFRALSGDPSLLPADWAKACGAPNGEQTARVVRDYIAGMTDNYALQEHKRIFHTEIAL